MPRMGSLQQKSTVVLDERSETAELDALTSTTPFNQFLSALDRARPSLHHQAEIALYEKWIAANSGISPLLYAAWFNLGVLFATVGNKAGAAIAYSNALAQRPEMLGAAINLGLLLEQCGQTDQALATWKNAAQPDEARLALEIQQGRLLEKLGRFDEAEKILRRALLTDPAQLDVIHHWVHIRQKSCLWPVALPNIPDLTPADLLRRSGPLGVLALTDDIELQ